MDNLFTSLLENNKMQGRKDNIEELKRVNINGISTFKYLEEQLTKHYYTDKEKETIKEILTIPKDVRYRNLINKHIPKPSELTPSQIERIVLCVKEGFHLAKIMKKSFDTKRYIIKQIHTRYNPKNPSTPELYEDGEHKHKLLLTGGAIRDILFLKDCNIKDLDFCYAFMRDNSWSNIAPISHIHPASLSQFLKKGQLPDDFQKEPEYQKLLEKVQDYVKYIKDSETSKNILESFQYAYFLRYEMTKNGASSEAIYVGLHDEELLNRLGWEEYINIDLAATIKTFGTTGIPVDVLFSAYQAELVIKNFDFCICKSSLDFSSLLDTNTDVPETDEDCIRYFYQNLEIPFTVLRDIDDRKISVTKTYANHPEKIEFFKKKHLPRLLKKYPGFEFNVEGSIGDERAFLNRDKFLQKDLIDAALNNCVVQNDENIISNTNFKI